MKLVSFRNFLLVGGLAFLVLMGGSYEAQAKGRGRGDSKQDKKCAKFVNCHDASEGRVDGRGPRRGTDDDDWRWRRSRDRRDDDRIGDHQRHRRQRDRRLDRNDDWQRRRDIRRHDTWSRRRDTDRDDTWSRRRVTGRDDTWSRRRVTGRDDTWSRRGR
jgi:hypothetical protein